MSKQNYNNEKTINHEYFTSERHFINYCFRVCSTQLLSHPKLTIKNLDHFAWSLAHESVFKRNWIKPPYAVLISILKKDSPQKDMDFIFGEFLEELIKLRYGNCELKDCNCITKFEFYEGSGYLVQYGAWGYASKMLKLMNQLQDKYGVYKLYDKNKNLIYVGKSYTLSNRIISSVKEQQAHYFKFMITDTQADANLLEQYYISTERPSNNAMGLTFDMLTVSITHKYSFSDIIKIYKDS